MREREWLNELVITIMLTLFNRVTASRMTILNEIVNEVRIEDLNDE